MRTLLEWRCGYCDSIQQSDSVKRWSMDYCKCGESFVDLEEHYQRNMGEVIVMNTSVFGEIDTNDIHKIRVYDAKKGIKPELSDEEILEWIKSYSKFKKK
jgi:hypothetical protein